MMRLILIACFVMIGVAANANDHVCGEGPHEITVHGVMGCPCNSPTLVPQNGGTYSQNGWVTCNLNLCPYEYTETWTDWPECKGAKLVSRP